MAQLKIDLVLNKIQAMTGLRSFESNVMTIGKRLAGFVGIGGGIAGITTTIQGLLDKASRLQDLSDAFNISAESIQKLGNVAATSNISLEEAGSKLGKLAKAAQEAAKDKSGDLAKTFEKIGLSASELNRLSPFELFDRLRIAISSGKLAGQDLSVVNQLLAKDYQRFVPLLRMSTEEFYKLAEAGGIMSDEVVSQLDAVNQTIILFQENVSKRMATATADVLDFLSVVSKDPRLFAKLFFSTDISAIEEVGRRATDKRNKLREEIAAERKARAGSGSMVEDEKENERILKDQERAKTDLLKAEERYKNAVRDRETKSLDTTEQIGRAEAELVALKSDAASLAEQTAEKFEALQKIEEKRLEIINLQNQAQEDAVRLAEEEARAAEKLSDTRQRIEELVAERAGPKAELELQKRRAAEAAQAARERGTPEQILAANQEANRLQRMLESNLQNLGFGDASLSRARMQAQQITGMVPGVESLRDIMTKPDVSQPQKIQVDRLPLSDVLQRLDDLIRSAGKFGT
jgi:hypothetical protein